MSTYIDVHDFIKNSLRIYASMNWVLSGQGNALSPFLYWLKLTYCQPKFSKQKFTRNATWYPISKLNWIQMLVELMQQY